MKEKERFPYLDAKKLRQKSTRMLVGGTLLTAAAIGSFFATEAKLQDPHTSIPAEAANSFGLISGVILVSKGKELLDAAELQEGFDALKSVKTQHQNKDLQS